jgi:N-acetylglucosaminyl-diphospho-decaprenol L-rhamnosyltransferase
MSGFIHIVIVNWNTGDCLRECLASVAASQGGDDMISKVTVVDNASTDGSAEGLDVPSLPVEVLRNAENVGFARACNQGAAGSTADYLLFLNPDTRLFPATLAAVTRFMESEEAAGIGVCGVEVVDTAGRPAISCARFPSLRVLFGEMTGLCRVLPQVFPRHQITGNELPQSQVVDQVIGAFFFVSRDLFDRLEGFDERYFLYFEEVDFALRARRQGARSYVLKEARLFHAEHVSSSQIGGARLHHSLCSRLLFAYRHWPRWQANLLLGLTVTVEFVARLATGAVRRSASDIRATVEGYRRLFGDMPHLRRGAADHSLARRLSNGPSV